LFVSELEAAKKSSVQNQGGFLGEYRLFETLSEIAQELCSKSKREINRYFRVKTLFGFGYADSKRVFCR
jgi:hypothetical protein